ncbi:kinase-like protein [Thelephora ganbajun]|uniref:Kinase-like protein n=1 Tax=Thelephora ganbajun TaxID=370292 RepID=A0ACB6ZCX0_THEGA|nr:kinase-like protein [Thelephora ganbajun]
MTSNGAVSADKLEQLLKLCGNRGVPEAKAQKVVDQLDQSLNGRLDPSTKKRYLVSLMKICKAYCFVPTSHLILDADLQKLSDAPFKSEKQSNVWPGAYKGQETVSIKVLSRYTTDDEEGIKRRLCREAVIWKRMSHPNILPLIGITLSKELAVISPWMENENVLAYLKENHKANPVKLLEESVTGLQYLHGIGLVHGGLQGRHILVTDDGHACLANVGHASINRERGDSVFLSQMSMACDVGDGRYSPPEYFTDEYASMHSTKQGDIYSMGMTIYEVLTDKKPFPEYNSTSVVMPIIRGTRPSKPAFAISRGYTEGLWDLTIACWRQDPAERPTITNILGSLGNAALQWKSKIYTTAAIDDMDDQASA